MKNAQRPIDPDSISDEIKEDPIWNATSAMQTIPAA